MKRVSAFLVALSGILVILLVLTEFDNIDSDDVPLLLLIAVGGVNLLYYVYRNEYADKESETEKKNKELKLQIEQKKLEQQLEDLSSD